MAGSQNTLALVFDFDDTLTDDSTTLLLKEHGIDVTDFWSNKLKQLVDHGWDPAPAYLHLILERVRPGEPLDGLTNAKLREFGKKCTFYQGLPSLFDDLRALVQGHTLSHPSIEFYVISGGLEEVILGSEIAPYLNGVRGCRFAEKDGCVSAIMNVVTFTEKTRYLFEINKGLLTPTRRSAYAVNNDVAQEDRRVPLSNMIYVGDGLTDVPCFSLLEKAKGKGFGVFDPKKAGSPKKAWEQLAAPRRVTSLNAPKYGEDDELGALLRIAVESKCLELDLQTKLALGL